GGPQGFYLLADETAGRDDRSARPRAVPRRPRPPGARPAGAPGGSQLRGTARVVLAPGPARWRAVAPALGHAAPRRLLAFRVRAPPAAGPHAVRRPERHDGAGHRAAACVLLIA